MIDIKSITGWLSSALIGIFTTTNIDIALKLILGVISAAVGITTLIYNRMRIKQLKEQRKEKE